MKSDGSVWLWGNNSKSQLCDGTTVNRASPAKVILPGQVRATSVVAGGHSTIIRTSEGALYACGDNQAGLLGLDKQTVVSQLVLIPLPASRTTLVSMGGGNAAVSPDGCAVRLSGFNEGGIVGVVDVGHIKVVPERKMDLTRLWTGACDVIPQVDRIGGAIAQVSVFFNTDARSQFISATGEAPKLTGRVAGYPEYNHWVVITKDNRLPWIPQTLETGRCLGRGEPRPGTTSSSRHREPQDGGSHEATIAGERPGKQESCGS